MRNKTLPRVAQVLGFIVAMALLPAANALQITLNLPDCPSGQALSFNSATNTLTCGTGTPQTVNTPSSCSITASPPSDASNGLAAGTAVTLTALCTAGLSDITYSWNIGVQQPSITVVPQSTITYSVTPRNSAGFGSAFQTTVYIGNGGPGPQPTAPSGCFISQSPNTAASPVPAGTTVTLSMTCSGGSAVTGCSWSNAIAGNACTVNVAAPSSTTSYSATASNSGGSASATTTINISVPNPTPSAQNFCTGQDQQITVNWPADGQTKPRTNGFANQRVSFKITIPTTFNPPLNINHLGFMRLAEVPGATVTGRDFTVSKNACDFQSNDYIYSGIGAGDTAPYVSFSVNNPLGFLAAGAAVNLSGGDTVYFNVRNYTNTTPNCPYSSCDISFDFATPNRY